MRRLAGQFKPLNLIIAALLMLVAAAGFLWRSNQINPGKLTAKRPAGPLVSLHDYAGILTPPPPGLNQALERLQQICDIEAIIVTLHKNPDEMTLGQLARTLIDSWQIGRRHNQRGLLLLVAADSRRMQIGVGDGLTDLFPDTFRRRIQDWQWPSVLDADGFEAALLKTLAEIEKRVKLADAVDCRSRGGRHFHKDRLPPPTGQ